MLITYSYLTYFTTVAGDFQTKVYGDFQADIADFKKFFARSQHFIKALYCHLQDGREYIWQNPRYSLRAGWQKIR